jgi:hypothetical protein
MALRFLLVGLVVGLGIDLPAGAEMAGWVRSSGAWVQARVDGLFGPEPAEAAPAADAQFSAIVDGMANDFAADLARAEAPKADAAFAAVVDDMASGFARDLARAEPPAPEAPPTADSSFAAVVDDMAIRFAADADAARRPVAVAQEIRDAAAPPKVEAPEAPKPAPSVELARPDRLASAVQLTGQAAAAWLAVFQGRGTAAVIR